VIPTFYEILTDWRDWLGAKLRGHEPKAHGAPAAAPAHGTARNTVENPAR